MPGLQYDPKLKKAIAEVKAIFEKYDIGGVCMVHSPEHQLSEFLNYVKPSYSCVSFENGGVHIRASVASCGSIEARNKKMEDTYNMVTHFANMLGQNAMIYMNLQRLLKEEWNGSESSNSGTQSHNTQNN
jgi:hypothetical protein